MEEIREIWESHLNVLETNMKEQSGDVEKLIEKQLRGMGKKLTTKIIKFRIGVDSECLVKTLKGVGGELIAVNRSRMEGDDTNQKLDQIMLMMRQFQSQLDRVEKKMDQFFGELKESLGDIRQELSGNSRALADLRGIWIGRMDELEKIIRAGNADASKALDTCMKELHAELDEKLDDLDVSITRLEPQLEEMKKQLQSVAVGVAEGNNANQQILSQLKELQTQFVEMIHHQDAKLEEVTLFLPSSCIVLLFNLSLSHLITGTQHVEEFCCECKHSHLSHHVRSDSHSATQP
jgi:DNA repair exonuclease SbcCD ATPase subunit